MRDIAEHCPIAFIKYHKGIQHYIRTISPITPRNFKTNVYFYWGPPGTGKSRRAAEEAAETGLDTYYKPRGDWWDGYCGQGNVIMDDFYGWIKYDDLLKICDRYPYSVPIKGGYEIFITKNIWITSNVPIDLLYKFPGYDPAAIIRRCTLIEEIN